MRLLAANFDIPRTAAQAIEHGEFGSLRRNRRNQHRSNYASRPKQGPQAGIKHRLH
jgi:hypothetical protein